MESSSEDPKQLSGMQLQPYKLLYTMTPEYTSILQEENDSFNEGADEVLNYIPLYYYVL